MAIEGREAIFLDTMQNLLSYTRAAVEVYAVCFIDACIMNIVENMMISNFLAVNFKAYYGSFHTVR